MLPTIRSSSTHSRSSRRATLNRINFAHTLNSIAVPSLPQTPGGGLKFDPMMMGGRKKLRTEERKNNVFLGEIECERMRVEDIGDPLLRAVVEEELRM